MSERVRNIVAAGLITGALAVIVGVLATHSLSDVDRSHALAASLKCPVCTSESIADSPSAIARDLRDLISSQVEDGWSDQEVRDFFVATYGAQVLLDPGAGGRAAVLWIAPLAAFAIGLVVIAGRRAANPRRLSDDEERRVDKALAALDHE